MVHRPRVLIFSCAAAASIAASGLGAGVADASPARVPTRPSVTVAVAPSSAGPAGCGRTGNPSAHRYATGAECAPEGFPYEPVMKSTKAGPRATDPFDNGCSNSPDRWTTFDFRDACATHDYLADLQRFGAPGVPEASMDHQFLQDMRADCKKRFILQRPECEAAAFSYRAGVQEGDYAEGDEIDVN